MKWEDYKAQFEFDGSWRDIYILNTSVSDWQQLTDFLHSGAYKLSYTVDGNETALPQQVNEVFVTGNEATPLLSVHVGSALLCCHFFTDEEIEFDIDPRDIRNESQAGQLFAFMREVGQLLNKEVILTPENMQSLVIFRFLPGAERVEYMLCNT